MVNSSQFIVTIPQSTPVIFYLFNTNIFSAQAFCHKEPSAKIVYVPMVLNTTDFHTVRIVKFGQSRRITTSRITVTARRSLHVKRFMGPVLVVLKTETVKPPLLIAKS
jgi:hypothetical protein